MSRTQFDASASRNFSLPGVGVLTARFVIVNLFDRVYVIRNSIGVGAPQ